MGRRPRIGKGAVVNLEELFTVVDRLRHPQTGCPWDRTQRLPDLLTPLRNEVEEFAQAVQSGDAEHICEELGDVLFNVCMCVAAAEEAGLFARGATAATVMEKMIRRHPHVFGDETAQSIEEAQERYREAKSREKKR